MHLKSVCFLIAITLLLMPIQAAAADTGLFRESVQNQLAELELGDLLRFGELLEVEYQDFIPSLNWRELTGGGAGGPGLKQLLMVLLGRFLHEIRLSLHLLRQLVVIGILAALLQRLSSSFGSKAVLDLAFAVCFLVMAYIGLQSFRLVLAMAESTVDNMVSFMHSLLPTLSALLMAVGGLTSATIFHPLLWALVSAIAWLVHYLLFPLILFGTAFSLVAQFAVDFPLSRLGGLFRQAVITLLGAFFIIFSGFMAVRGAIAPVADGISLRTAKYLTKTLVPLAGGMFADALEIVVGGSLLIKNGVGAFGLAVIMFLAATPLLKVWAVVLVYKVVAALLEPISDRRLVQTLNNLAVSLTLVFASLGTVAVMFVITISIVVGLGNLAVFMR
ncbi:MAG TPA: stage III sporulation protein AE [Firmicutes bacterium]|nr:stage III sporulation protein AE [Bacillota bacterium]